MNTATHDLNKFYILGEWDLMEVKLCEYSNTQPHRISHLRTMGPNVGYSVNMKTKDAEAVDIHVTYIASDCILPFKF